MYSFASYFYFELELAINYFYHLGGVCHWLDNRLSLYVALYFIQVSNS